MIKQSGMFYVHDILLIIVTINSKLNVFPDFFAHNGSHLILKFFDDCPVFISMLCLQATPPSSLTSSSPDTAQSLNSRRGSSPSSVSPARSATGRQESPASESNNRGGSRPVSAELGKEL